MEVLFFKLEVSMNLQEMIDNVKMHPNDPLHSVMVLFLFFRYKGTGRLIPRLLAGQKTG